MAHFIQENFTFFMDCLGSGQVTYFVFIWDTCMDLYCIGVICSKPGGGTSQYSEGLRLLVLGLRSLDLDLGY